MPSDGDKQANNSKNDDHVVPDAAAAHGEGDRELFSGDDTTQFGDERARSGDASGFSDDVDLSPRGEAEKFDATPREIAESVAVSVDDAGASSSLVTVDGSGASSSLVSVDSSDASSSLVSVDGSDTSSSLVTVDDDDARTSLVTVDDDDADSIVRDDGDDDDGHPLFEEGDDGDAEPGSMTLVEHLGELRDRLARCLVYIACAFGVALYFGKTIIEFLERPAGGMKFQALSIEEPLIVFFKVTFYAAIVIASPFILFEVSRFIAPGLTRKEKQIVTPALVGGPILFVCGAAFAYYCMLPSMFHFFNSFGSGIAPIHQRLDFYMSLVASILLYMGLCFQLPIVIFALSFTGLVTSDQLIKIWRYAVFGASCVALVITPDPTAFSMLIVMGALVGLYAISVLLLKLFGR